MSDSLGLIASLRRQLEAHASPKSKAWWEAYVKGSAPFLGLKMVQIRSEMRRWHSEQIDGRLGLEQQKSLALALIREAHTEEKLAGMLLLQEILLPAGAAGREDLRDFASLFSDGFLYDWNACDWFCIKVLGPLIEREGEPCARAVSQWCHAENLWQARASVVAFVILAGAQEYYPRILEACSVLIGREERFAKTAVGWILRDMSKREAATVDTFVQVHLSDFSLESLRNALKHFPRDTAGKYVQMRKEARHE
jgi:3-methyladenine DNA glycosylase AlkD